MKNVLWLCMLLFSIIAAGCGDSTRGAERVVESAAERLVGYTPERLTEYPSIVECVTAVIKFEAQRDVINDVCPALSNKALEAKPNFRKYILCLRHGLDKTDNFQQAREVVATCAKDFPSPETNQYASILMVNKFPTAEQQQINLLKAQNERLETTRREEKYAQDINEIDQQTQQRLRDINQNYTDQMNAINARELANRPFNCVVNGNIVNCN